MTQNYTGMRKGISLVEMTIAIILFAVLAAVGLKYSKLFLNTDLQAKKARVAAATDQANQLVQAYTIYKVETGLEPTSINDLNGTSAILNDWPTKITEMSTKGWELNTSTGLAGTGFAFQLKLDKNISTSDTIDALHCAVFNREFNTSTELNVTNAFNFGTAAVKFARMGNYFCYGQATVNNPTIMVVVP
ncbi:MAG: prepilin-type cleavage/methylation domain-containing protein [Sulfuricurvum sp.]|nr:prepilin-type cleavage/methylation domain-containing protein [Sulfuricurvum sp.]